MFASLLEDRSQILESNDISIVSASENNLKNISLHIKKQRLTVVTGPSGSGKSSLVFDTLLKEAQRKFFYTLTPYSRQFFDLGPKAKVRALHGLCPAIGLKQHENLESKRATVGTFCDLVELLGLVFAKFAERLCPTHNINTGARDIKDWFKVLVANKKGNIVAICAPLVLAKKGSFKGLFTSLIELGFLRVVIDGEIVAISSIPELDKDKKHSVKLVVDCLRIKDEQDPRLARSLNLALQHGNGYAEVFTVGSGKIDENEGMIYSELNGCPECNYHWPKLDQRHFSPNSLGRCKVCNGRAFCGEEYEICQDCMGTGVGAEYAFVRFSSLSIHKCLLKSVKQLAEDINELRKKYELNSVLVTLLQKIKENLERIDQAGLGYLSLARRLFSLSDGELQRLKIANILAERLHGVLYVLDEPSQGLAPVEIERLEDMLRKLIADGNTVVVVDHNLGLIAHADWIVDLGPEGGVQGGNLLAQFAPKDAHQFCQVSKTAKFLLRNYELQRFISKNKKESSELIIFNKIKKNNVAIERVTFLRKALNVVVGVSGSGKSSLLLGHIFPQLDQEIRKAKEAKKAGHQQFNHIVCIDRALPRRASSSMPATYLEIFSQIRKIFAAQKDAQMLGLKEGMFSLKKDGGRCPHCSGRGFNQVQVKFLAESRFPCIYCKGKRFQAIVLEVLYKGYNIAQVLELTIAEALNFFSLNKRISRTLQVAEQLGLGYLILGQTLSSLSGGEAQRLKLVHYFTKENLEKSFIVMDEPCVGLHSTDIEKLVKSIKNLINSQESTFAIIENRLEMASQADWLIELGPGSAEAGGRLIYNGGRV